MSNAIVNGIAGAGGGIVAQIITYPLQTVPLSLSPLVFLFCKLVCSYIVLLLLLLNTIAALQVNTRQQTERVAKGSIPSSSPARNTLIQIFHLIKTEGIGGLYSGLKPSLLGTAASQVPILFSQIPSWTIHTLTLRLSNHFPYLKLPGYLLLFLSGFQKQGRCYCRYK